MHAFEYLRPAEVGQATATVAADPAASFLAGGTTQLDLMKDGVLAPDRLVDITRLPLRGVDRDGDTLVVGALTSMEELAAEPAVAELLPVVHEALLLGASVQLRNMATIGGNLLQRTRCRYFRDPTTPCNKRHRGAGCAALDGVHRGHAVLGTSEHCIATHASDLAVALVALDAAVRVSGPDGGERRVPLTDLYRTPGDTPDVETVLEHGELITAVEVPLLPPGARSHYLKIRDRASYDFALTSVAVALVVEDGVVRRARVGLGGLATVPWRAWAAEDVLLGAPARTDVFHAAGRAALDGAVPRRDNAFKVELGRRALVRALQTVSGVYW
ncbi:FAD binding domain-containing protein [Allostreptomyces psammosilenae]|uniref:Xanthine dehydrogenase YagS FAD-binding subunit n=1 Tax=Allostreptomyces psammosilenae TaxID=1892865 RepID=A0A853A889_9ACTN|nr:xanthine dehydrogenase family protein subunit M [Allostreptomyces psammosilenae]NYI06748.1 xanthine dehydrogenase YagS FAD-binding subunit [Allostreptomyces psammosilenae]